MKANARFDGFLKLMGCIAIALFELFPFIFFPSITSNYPALVLVILVVFFIGADIFIRPVGSRNDKDNYNTWKIYLFFVVSPLMLLIPYVENIFLAKTYQNTFVLNIVYWVGFIFTVWGGLLLIFSRIVIGRFGTPKISIQKEHMLITDGPYKIIRNPLYLADLLLYGGYAIAFGAWFSFVFILFVLLLILLERINIEERILEENFKDEYTAWKNKTWRLIPYIW